MQAGHFQADLRTTPLCPSAMVLARFTAPLRAFADYELGWSSARDPIDDRVRIGLVRGLGRWPGRAGRWASMLPIVTSPPM